LVVFGHPEETTLEKYKRAHLTYKLLLHYLGKCEMRRSYRNGTSLIKNKLCRRPPQYARAPCKLTFDFESGVRVMCDAGYLCANFSLPRPLCSRPRPDVCDRQTDVIRRASSLNSSALWGRGI